MRPTLPDRSTDPQARARALAHARSAYEYDFSYEGLAFLRSLPLREMFPPRYLAKGAEVTARIAANRAASGIERAIERAGDGWSEMFAALPAPLALPVWREDFCFAWQRLAGPCPILIRRAGALPAALRDEDAARVIPGATLASLAAKGRLFVADYAMFAGAAAGATDGRPKHLWAPLVIFAADPALRGGLAPIAIRIGEGGRETIYTPADPDWMIARTAAQIADENLQGVLVHLGWCHLVVQRFIVSAHRQLAPEHPLMVLFAPHFELTLAVNQVARDSVVNPGGVQDRLLAPTIEAQAALLRESLATIDLASLDPTVDFARRGVADREALPLYPFRDDSLLLWAATRAFVAEYVRLYYESDADVTGDAELAAMIREIGAEDGGRMPALVADGPPRTVEQVIDLAARVIFRATTYHAAINDSNYDWAGYVANVPTAGFAPLPPRGAGDAERAAMLPPVELGWETIQATYQVAALHTNRLGDYPGDPFGADPRVAPLLERFRAALASIETEIVARNAARPLPYPYLVPSAITASINA